MTRRGRKAAVAFSRLANRLAVLVAISLPIRIHPWLAAGSSTHPCTSASMTLDAHA
jgi:hypothetical protein